MKCDLGWSEEMFKKRLGCTYDGDENKEDEPSGTRGEEGEGSHDGGRGKKDQGEEEARWLYLLLEGSIAGDK